MKPLDIIAIAFSNLTSNKLRTALTVIGIGVGIATVVFLVSLGYGLQELSLKRIASIEAVNTVNVSAGKVAAPDLAFIDKYKADSRVEKVLPVNSLPVQINFNGKKIDGVSSIVPSDFFSLEGLKSETGDFYKADAIKSVVVSSGIVKALDTESGKLIGQELPIRLVTRDAAGTVKSSDVSLKVMGVFADDTSITAYISSDILPTVGALAINQVKVKVRDQAQILIVKKEIEESGYSTTAVADTLGQLNTVFRIVQIGLGVVGGIALVVASIGMFNTMTIALLERIRDVGVMKATGADDSSIYLLFLIEAILISVLGGLSGLILGWGTTKVVNLAVNMLAKSVGGEPANLFTTPLAFVGVILLFSFVVGFSTGFLPARRGSKINPLDALRYE